MVNANEEMNRMGISTSNRVLIEGRLSRRNIWDNHLNKKNGPTNRSAIIANRIIVKEGPSVEWSIKEFIPIVFRLEEESKN